MKRLKVLFEVLLLFLFLTNINFSCAAENAESQLVKPGEVLTVQKCVELALINNPNIGLANNLTKVYTSKIGQAKAAYLPQINVSSGYSRQNPIISNTLYKNEKNNNQYSGSVSLNQMLYDFGKTDTKVSIQKLNLNSSKYDIDEQIVQVAYDTKQAYYSALLSKISKDIYSQTIKQNELHLKQAKAFFNTGIKAKIDVTNAEVNLSNAKLEYLKADNTYKTAISNLNNAMGVPDAPDYQIVDTVLLKKPGSLQYSEELVASKSKKNDKNATKQATTLSTGIAKYDVVDNLTYDKYQINFEDAIKKAYDNRPDLKSIIEKENAAKASVKLAKKDYLPNLNAAATYGTGGQEFPLDTGWSFGASLSIPVFNGLLTKYNINEAKANLDVTSSNVEILKQSIYSAVQQSYINLKQAEKSIPVAELISKQAKENFELATGRYNAGVGSSVEVIDAQTNYSSAQLTYVQSLYQYNMARINLEKAMGVK